MVVPVDPGSPRAALQCFLAAARGPIVLLIGVDRPVGVGDWVIVDGVEGEVEALLREHASTWPGARFAYPTQTVNLRS